MDDGLKQRLIGAIVLVAIAVLFVPSLFEKNSQRTVDLDTQIPQRPDVVTEILELPEPIRPNNTPPAPAIEPINEVEVAPQSIAEANIPVSSDVQIVEPQVIEPQAVEPQVSEAATGSNSAPSASVLDNDGVPVTWSIQIASFESKPRALALIGKLQADGHQSYHREVRGSQGLRYRVFVGPKINKQHILEAKATIDKKYNTSAIVVEFKNQI